VLTTINGRLTYAIIEPCTPPPAEPLRLEPSPRGRVLLRLMRHRARYLDLFHAAEAARDAAAAWDLTLIRVERDIAGTADDIMGRPIYSVANVVDLALVAHNRREESAFVADLVRSATTA
jgi:hypothetical protein